MKIIGEVKNDKNSDISMLTIECICGCKKDIRFNEGDSDVLIACPKCNAYATLFSSLNEESWDIHPDLSTLTVKEFDKLINNDKCTGFVVLLSKEEYAEGNLLSLALNDGRFVVKELTFKDLELDGNIDSINREALKRRLKLECIKDWIISDKKALIFVYKLMGKYIKCTFKHPLDLYTDMEDYNKIDIVFEDIDCLEYSCYMYPDHTVKLNDE